MFGSFRLLYSEICSYFDKSWQQSRNKNNKVFVSYIRRYVLTMNFQNKCYALRIVFSSPIFGDMFLLAMNQTHTDVTEELFSSPIFGDMFLLQGLQINHEDTVGMFSSPIFGDMFLLNLGYG